MTAMTLSDLATVAAASIGIAVSRPSRVSLPAGCPVSAFMCVATLPAGCLSPPGPLPRRTGAGSALDTDTARDLCFLEGIERFSLQYRDGDPDEVLAADMPGCRAVSLPAWRLRLGHPAYLEGAPLADSRGCAAGAALADAALRGLMELAEQDAVDAWHRGEVQFRPMGATVSDRPLFGLLAWVEEYGLRLRLLRHRHPSGAVVCIAICSDFSAERPAIGSAAGLAVAPVGLHACIEAVVAWFNLDSIERNGGVVDDTTPETRLAIETWRGVRPLPPIAGAGNEPVPAMPAPRDPEAAFAEAVAAWGIEAAVFDLSRPETGIVTARVVRLEG